MALNAITAKFRALSHRECEILHHIGQGETPDEVADRLHLSVHTVYEHVRRGVNKVGARNQRHLASLFLEYELMGGVVREEV